MGERECHGAGDENKLLPLSGIAERNISIGAISKNGELPNSVAESVLGPSTLHENYVLYGGTSNTNVPGRTSAFSTVHQEVDKQQPSQPNDGDCFVPLSNAFPSQVTSIAENNQESTSGIGEFWTRARYSCGVDSTVDQLRGCWPNISLESPSYNRSISLESKIDPEFKSTSDAALTTAKESRKTTPLTSLQTDEEYTRMMKTSDVANHEAVATRSPDSGKKKSCNRRKKSKN